MHPTAEPDYDDRDTIPPPVFYAEQALLGALLLQPHRLADITGVSPDSFNHHPHMALFNAMRSQPAPDARRHATTTAWLDHVLAAAREQAPGLTSAHLHLLVQSCPSPRHAPAYARIVESEHARRRLIRAAQRLARTARDTSHPDPVPATLADADALTAVVNDIAARFPARSALLPRTPTPEPTAVHDTEEAIDEEQLLLATATAHPDDIERTRWLNQNDFAHPLHAGLWQCLTALARRREPVDPVTVLWEAQQRRLLTPGTEPADLLTLLATPTGSLEHWGIRILQRALLTTAHEVARRIEAFTNDPATTPHQFILGSRRVLVGLTSVRTRWHRATAPASSVVKPQRARGSPPRPSPSRSWVSAAPRISR
ncbi:DnaB-like helicase N-terminal domain-containing protein [Streptomyces meridianus]|uniref:Replicative DNA helicase n=1 Tax=Streptomyces meridianus TaxID=2938945 RepID=A0ABT0XAY3_9ACTN|nr:DnaB-like helicase N-terminal domain-containing protein [Streptomyces meridianus]MCM2579672.1 replicative DNA helicase [Streptomyces meridianus]